MTRDFRAFLCWAVIYAFLAAQLVLFIPTLGHSYRWLRHLAWVWTWKKSYINADSIEHLWHLG